MTGRHMRALRRRRALARFARRAAFRVAIAAAMTAGGMVVLQFRTGQAPHPVPHFTSTPDVAKIHGHR